MYSLSRTPVLTVNAHHSWRRRRASRVDDVVMRRSRARVGIRSRFDARRFRRALGDTPRTSRARSFDFLRRVRARVRRAIARATRSMAMARAARDRARR